MSGMEPATIHNLCLQSPSTAPIAVFDDVPDRPSPRARHRIFRHPAPCRAGDVHPILKHPHRRGGTCQDTTGTDGYAPCALNARNAPSPCRTGKGAHGHIQNTRSSDFDSNKQTCGGPITHRTKPPLLPNLCPDPRPHLADHGLAGRLALHARRAVGQLSDRTGYRRRRARDAAPLHLRAAHVRSRRHLLRHPDELAVCAGRDPRPSSTQPHPD